MRVAQMWIQRYFDARSKPGLDALAQIKQLSATSITFEMPTISESLEAVRGYKSRRERTPGDVLLVFLGLCCLGLMGFSTLTTAAGLAPRADYLVYGRYGEPGYAALMVAAIGWLAAGSRRRLWALGAAPLVAAVAAVVLGQLAPAGSLEQPANFANMAFASSRASARMMSATPSHCWPWSWVSITRSMTTVTATRAARRLAK